MQPDPAIFLRGIRHELLRADLFKGALEEGLSPIIMARAAEGLAQLSLRYGDLPAIVADVAARQYAILQGAAATLVSAGMALPDISKKVLANPPARAGGEIDQYDDLVRAIGACILGLDRAAGSDSALSAALKKLCSDASEVELAVRTRSAEQLQRAKNEDAIARSKVVPPAPEPTDAAVTELLRARLPGSPDVTASRVRRRPGVNTKEIFFLELSNHAELDGPMVLRREPRYNATRSPVADEFELLKFLGRNGVKVPRVLIADASGTLGGSAIIMQRLEGATQTPEELGVTQGKPVVRAIADQLARIHRLDAATLDPPHRHDGASPAAIMTGLVDRCLSRWHEERTEGSVVLESAFSWLRSNVQCLDRHVCLVHGDFNFRNVLLNGTQVAAVLDWELAHAGHPAEDLAYIRPDIEKLVPWQDFMAAYAEFGGYPVSAEALRYFRVWTDVWRVALAVSVYASYVRGEHNNFLLASVAYVEYYKSLDPLCEFMARESSRP